MKDNASIEILQVKNGFVVRPRSSIYGGEPPAPEECFVFESFDGMASWLSSHFTHRAGEKPQ